MMTSDAKSAGLKHRVVRCPDGRSPVRDDGTSTTYLRMGSCDPDKYNHHQGGKDRKTISLLSIALMVSIAAAIGFWSGMEYEERIVASKHHQSPLRPFVQQQQQDDDAADDPIIKSAPVTKQDTTIIKPKENQKSSEGTSSETSSSDENSEQTPGGEGLYGKMNHGLYRFKAETLGKHFLKATAFFDDWIGSDVDSMGFAFAKQRTADPEVKEYHSQCFDYPNGDQMLELEERKKEHKKKKEMSRLDFLKEEQEFFYNTTDISQEDLVHITSNKKWAWRTTAVFSAQYSSRQGEFRDHVNGMLRKDKYLSSGISGTFWYPPNAIREWHTNAWDVSVQDGKMRKPWRMYYVRQRPVDKEHDVDLEDKSAFHLTDGNGITPDRLQSVGAYQLTHYDPNGDKPNVWRVPDQNGYVTLFRLEVDEPYRWHCIVADETVHRYSMGMALSDESVEELLEHIGVEM